MNVLIVVPWDNFGGVSRVVNHVAAALDREGHRVTFLLPGRNAPGERSAAGFPVRRMRLRPAAVASAPIKSRIAWLATLVPTLRSLRSLIRELRIDVVNVHFPDESAAAIALLRRFTSIRLVTSIHGADLLPSVGDATVPQNGIEWLIGASDAIVAPSAGFGVAATEGWPRLSRKTITVIPNGIDPAELGAPAPSGDAQYVISVATLIHYKGIDVLIRAFASLAADFPALELRLVSDGPQRAEYEALAQSLGVAERVRFLGNLGRGDVADQLRAATLFVLPSRTNSESFGIALAEAMALDRPVIGSRVGGVPDLVIPGETGMLVPPGEVIPLANAMRHMLGDPALRARLGSAAGIRTRREFLWTATETRYLQLFARLMGAQHAAGAN